MSFGIDTDEREMWLPEDLFVYLRINKNGESHKIRVMFKVEGNKEIEMLLNDNVNEVCSEILSVWMDWVANGGYTLGLYDFMGEHLEDLDIEIQDTDVVLEESMFDFEELHRAVCEVSSQMAGG